MAPASARPASPIVDATRQGMGAARRSRRSCAAFQLSSTCSCCCCRASASLTIRSAGEGVIGRNYTHQTISGRHRLFRQGKIQLQSVHRLGRDRHVHRRVQRRQFRSWSARLRRRRLYRARCRPTDGRSRRRQCPPGTPRWGAKWKQAVRGQLSVEPLTAGYRRARQLLQLSRELSSISIRPTRIASVGRCVRMTMDFHDNEIKDERLPHRPLCRDRQGHGRPHGGSSKPRKAPYDVTQYQTTHLCGGAIMGARSRQQRRQPLSAELGRAEPVRSGCQRVSRRTPATIRPARVGALAFWSAAAIRDRISEKPRTAGPCVEATRCAAPSWRRSR